MLLHKRNNWLWLDKEYAEKCEYFDSFNAFEFSSDTWISILREYHWKIIELKLIGHWRNKNNVNFVCRKFHVVYLITGVWMWEGNSRIYFLSNNSCHLKHRLELYIGSFIEAPNWIVVITVGRWKYTFIEWVKNQ